MVQVHTQCNTKIKRIRLRNGRTSWLCPTCERTIAPTEIGSAEEDTVTIRVDVFDLMMVIAYADAEEMIEWLLGHPALVSYYGDRDNVYECLSPLLKRFTYYLKGKVNDGRQAKDPT